MRAWSDGYVTDLGYTFGFYREQAPSHLKMICRLQAVAEPGGPLTYIELGCGQGFGLNLLAAANPDARFVGVDFSPGHVAGARRLAAEAGLSNVVFLEEGFSDLAREPDALPDADMIVLHGVYSWIAPAQREAIRSIIRRKLKTGGLVYLSYNCMTGWAPLAVFQRLLRDIALTRSGTSAERAKSALATLTKLQQSGLQSLSETTALGKLVKHAATQHPSYLAHEYLNEHWTPMYFADVARDLADCRLTYIGSAQPAANGDRYTLIPDIAGAMRAEVGADLHESIRDLAVERRFRKDVFGRGAVSLTRATAALGAADLAFALVKPRETIDMKVAVPRGQLAMGRDIYRKALDVLERGPGRLAEVVPAGANAEPLFELATVLGQMDAVYPITDDAADGSAARALNLAITDQTAGLMVYGFAAVARLRSAIPIDRRFRPAFAVALRRPGLDAEQIAKELERLASSPAYAGVAELWQNKPWSPEDRAGLDRWLATWRGLGMVA